VREGGISVVDDVLRAPRAGRPRLEFRLLGPLEVQHDGRALSLGGAKPRALLTDLVLHAGQVVSTDRLVDDLWGENPPETASHAVEVYVSQLRKALDPGRPGQSNSILARSQRGYLLDVDPEQVDLYRFRRLVDEGRGALADGDAAYASLALRQALGLWRGPAIADFVYEPFAQADIAELEELRLSATEARIEAELALGRHAALVGELEALVAAEPLRERPRRQLMLALYRSGRQADALAAYQAARHALVEELGLEPGTELRELEAAILRHDEALAAPAPARATDEAEIRQKRTFATILFADLADSTALAERLDAETLHGVMGRYFDTVSAVVARHGGTVEKFAGDAVMAAFGIPVTHEDDALRAARTAVEVQASIAALSEALTGELDVGLSVRIGIESGEVFAADNASNQTFVTGAPVITAARLQQSAAPGETVVGEVAKRLVAHGASLDPLGLLSLKGKTESVAGFRLLEVEDAAPSVARRQDAPFVGRERELRALRRALSRAAAARAVQVISVVGPAGIGKSRLVDELVRLAGADVIALGGRCLSYGEGITYWPLRSIVRQAAGDVSRDAIEALLTGAEGAREIAAKLTAALGAGDEALSAAEISWAFRRFCEALASRRPLLLVFDDLHWAEPTLLELVEHLADRSSASPIVLVCLARDELFEDHPLFLEARANVETVRAEALSRAETELLLDGLLGGADVPDEARARLVETAEGNPLFLEQLLVFVREHGANALERQLPPTIQALLAGRLDRLGPGERAVLERAAVVGKEFRESAVAALLAPEATLTLARHLRALTTRGFVEPAPTVFFEGSFRFRHALIQEAAYRAAPKQERAVLHERFADWLERTARERVREIEELVGYHLEQAHELRIELAPPDRHAKQLAAEAAERLGSAGIRAAKRGDAPAAANLLRRAAALLPSDDDRRLELLCELGGALRATGDVEQAARVLEDAVESAARVRNHRIELRGRIELTGLRLFSDPEGRATELLELAEQAIPVFESIGDDRSLGRTWLLTGFVHGGIRCRNAEWEESARRALAHYERARWPVSTCLGQLSAAMYYGPTPVPAAIRRCEALLRETAGDPLSEANVLALLGGLEAQNGQFAEARESIARARCAYEALGQVAAAATFCGAVAGDIELLAGNQAAAAEALRWACEILEHAGDLSALSSREAELAEALYVGGRYDETEHWLARSEHHAASDDLAVQLVWRSVQAKMLARGGALAEAEELAAETARIAEQTDALNLRARVLLSLAEVRRMDGRSDDSVAPIEEAIRLFELKGNVVSAEDARALLDLATLT
jgi:DNA-binding SARP family transcriptional activator